MRNWRRFRGVVGAWYNTWPRDFELLVFWNATLEVKNHEFSIVKLIIVIRGRRGRQADEMGALIIAKNVEARLSFRHCCLRYVK